MKLIREEVLQTVDAVQKYYRSLGRNDQSTPEIEFYHQGEWKSISSPTFDSENMLYRVKPKQKSIVKVGDRVRRCGGNDEYLVIGISSTGVLVGALALNFHQFHERYEIL